MELKQTDPNLPAEIQPPVLSKIDIAERNRAQAVHMQVAQQFGRPVNRQSRRRHEARVRKILQTLPPFTERPAHLDGADHANA